MHKRQSNKRMNGCSERKGVCGLISRTLVNKVFFFILIGRRTSEAPGLGLKLGNDALIFEVDLNKNITIIITRRVDKVVSLAETRHIH